MTMKNPTPKEQKYIQQKLLQVGLKIEAEAKKRCPVDTGRLRASINTQKTGKMQVQVGSNVEYAPYVEYGTSKMQAQPYLRPAVDQVLNNIHEFNTVKTNMR